MWNLCISTCRLALPLALAWPYYSTCFFWKIVDKLTSDGWILTYMNGLWIKYTLNYSGFMNYLWPSSWRLLTVLLPPFLFRVFLFLHYFLQKRRTGSSLPVLQAVENPLWGFSTVFCSLLRALLVRRWRTTRTLAAWDVFSSTYTPRPKTVLTLFSASAENSAKLFWQSEEREVLFPFFFYTSF